ncbi:OLC1v1038148C1 [Oldenlandia corymbosa var. corymbosa]|uniref:OLC1v1038148C1 n=1 Tax=Oldenlandia corymbosa var. corymbosa TaxID=529605 RepID=A0AAV1CZT3_OLDCO|nr:OLC1v1038148C1 [Oldenlandia corymbosa var. corymbosa]
MPCLFDRRDVFVCLLNDLTREEVEILDPLVWILRYDSVRCLEAVLNGETAGLFEIDVNSVPFESSDERLELVPILHAVCSYGLSVASEITKFCLPANESQREDGEVVSVEIEQELLKYVNEGKLLELTALLMFARDIVTPSLEGGSKIRDFVLQEIAALKISTSWEDSYHSASRKAIGNNESTPGSSLWLLNKIKLLHSINCHIEPNFSLRLYHTHHFVRGRRRFGTSVMGKKVGSSFHLKHHFVRASGGLESTTTVV